VVGVIRDYLHVRDVCDAHVHAINYLDKNPGFHIYNLGTNKGTSIKQLIAQFITTTGMNLQFATGDPRLVILTS
jgi:UDP-glucose 4-epimerase